MSKKLRVIIPIIVISIVVVGGGSLAYANHLKKEKINNEVLAGISAMKAKNYNEAKADMEKVIALDKDNVKAEQVINCINSYENLKNDVNSKDIEKAQKDIDNLPKYYEDYSIKSEIDSCKATFESEKSNIDKINKEISDISSLVSKKEFEKANKAIEALDSKDMTEAQKNQVNEIKANVQKSFKAKQEEIAKEKKAEEAKKKEALEKEQVSSKMAEKQTTTTDNKKMAVDTVNHNKYVAPTQEGTYKNQPVAPIQEEGLYRNEALGLQMNFPPSWQGKYRIVDGTDGGFTVYLKLRDGGNSQGQGQLFEVAKYSDMKNMLGMFDTIPGSKRYVYSSNGTKYVIGGPTDVDIDQNNPQAKEFMSMGEGAGIVTNTIRAI